MNEQARKNKVQEWAEEQSLISATFVLWNYKTHSEIAIKSNKAKLARIKLMMKQLMIAKESIESK